MKLSRFQNIALYLFFFSINFEVWDPLNTGGHFSISKLTGFLYFATLMPQLGFFLKTKGYISFLRPIWIFFIYLTIISFLNINSSSYSYFNFSIFQNIILLTVLINQAEKKPGIIAKGMFFFAVGSVALSVLFYFGIGVDLDQDGRISLFGDNANNVGIRMCISMLYLSFFVFLNPFQFSNKRFLLLIPLPVMLSLMVQSGSRVAFISFFTCFIISFLLLRTQKIHVRVLAFTVGTIIGIYIFNYVLSSEVLYGRLMNSAEEHNLAGRDVIWKSLLPLVENNLIFGVGTTGYASYSNRVFGQISSPHNVLLEVLCYTGIIGLSLYLLFWVRVAKTAFIKYRNNGSFIQLILLIPLLGLILSGQLLVTKIGWILFAFAVSRSSAKGIKFKPNLS